MTYLFDGAQYGSTGCWSDLARIAGTMSIAEAERREHADRIETVAAQHPRPRSPQHD